MKINLTKNTAIASAAASTASANNNNNKENNAMNTTPNAVEINTTTTHKTVTELVVEFNEKKLGCVTPVINGTPRPEMNFYYKTEASKQKHIALFTDALKITEGNTFSAMSLIMGTAEAISSGKVKGKRQLTIGGRTYNYDPSKKEVYTIYGEMIASVPEGITGNDAKEVLIHRVLRWMAENNIEVKPDNAMKGYSTNPETMTKNEFALKWAVKGLRCKPLFINGTYCGGECYFVGADEKALDEFTETVVVNSDSLDDFYHKLSEVEAWMTSNEVPDFEIEVNGNIYLVKDKMVYESVNGARNLLVDGSEIKVKSKVALKTILADMIGEELAKRHNNDDDYDYEEDEEDYDDEIVERINNLRRDLRVQQELIEAFNELTGFNMLG